MRRVGRPGRRGLGGIGEGRHAPEVVQVLEAEHRLDPRADHRMGRDDEHPRASDGAIIGTPRLLEPMTVLLNTPERG